MSSNEDIKHIHLSLLNIYDKISKQTTQNVGIELFRRLIHNSTGQKNKMIYILNELSEHTKKLNGQDKKEALILLPFIIQNKANLLCLRRILNILYDTISIQTETIHDNIANTFGDLVVEVNQASIDNSTNYINELKNFCFEIINNSVYCNKIIANKELQICGCLFLYKFIYYTSQVGNNEKLNEEIAFVLIPLINMLNNRFYSAKNELLRCIFAFILKIGQFFNPFAKDSINKILTLLNSGIAIEWQNKKTLLDIIYKIIIFCEKEINEYIDDIVYYAKMYKVDKVKEVRSSAMSILDILNKNEPKTRNYLSQSVRKKRSNWLMISQRENIRKDYNDKFEFVEKKIDNAKKLDIKFNELEYQLKKMQNMQLELFKNVNNIQRGLNMTYSNFNKRLEQLENKVNEYKSSEYIKENKILNNYSDIEEEIKKGNYDKAVEISFRDDDEFLFLIESLESSDINEFSKETIEDIISRLISLININKNSQKKRYAEILQNIMINYNQDNLRENTKIIIKGVLKNE